MEYIILAAGVGTRLYPYTKNTPKCLVKVSDTETVIERAVRLISTLDKEAEITVVLGFCSNQIMELLGNKCRYIINPFYKVTNSVASLWFARDTLLKGKPVVVLNADIVFSWALAKKITEVPSETVIYYDSSIHVHGDYNVQELDGYMVVMGKELEDYSGEYIGITKYDSSGAKKLFEEIDSLVMDELYDQWYENGLVQLSLSGRHLFRVVDVCDYEWSEIDSICNLLKIRNIIKDECAL